MSLSTLAAKHLNTGVSDIRKKSTRVTQKFLDLPPGARTANGTALCHCEFWRHNPLCCFSTSNTKDKRIFIDLVRKLLDTRWYVKYTLDSVLYNLHVITVTSWAVSQY
jgi:hypothetical protein